MNVVSKHMITITEKILLFSTPSRRPMFRTINSTKPLVFISTAITADSLFGILHKYEATPAPMNLPIVAIRHIAIKMTTSGYTCKVVKSVCSPDIAKYNGNRNKCTKVSNILIEEKYSRLFRGIISPI